MPCSDSSSGLNLFLDTEDRLVRFEFAKITCSSEISAATGLSDFCKAKDLREILDLDFAMLVSALDLNADAERQFIMHMELDALKAGIVQYLGLEHDKADNERCQVSGIEHTPHGVEIALIILPPKELPKIMPCSLKDREIN